MRIGEWNKEKAQNLRAEIFWHGERHPFVTQAEIAVHFNINPGTVSRHVRAIKDGWRPARKIEAKAG